MQTKTNVLLLKLPKCNHSRVSLFFCRLGATWKKNRIFFKDLLQLLLVNFCIKLTLCSSLYSGKHGLVHRDAPTLAICYDNGRMQIMRDENDESKLIFVYINKKYFFLIESVTSTFTEVILDRISEPSKKT